MISLAATAEMHPRTAPATLEVLREAKLADLLGSAARGLTRFEASGVLVHDDALWVIFDNVPDVALLHPRLLPGHTDSWIHGAGLAGIGFEDIAIDPQDGTFFLLVEAERAPGGALLAKVHECDERLSPTRQRWLDAPIERVNKGIEGLTCLRRNGKRFLLGLCEGNDGRGGKAGRRPGRGLVHVFTEDDALPRSTDAGPASWARAATIHLPPDLPFTDYSGISHRAGVLAVVSQESSMLWVGRLDASTWSLVDEGRTYRFPRDGRGKILYGTIEGVSWLSDRELAVVSDRCKRTQPARMRAKDQSVHVVALPETLG